MDSRSGSADTSDGCGEVSRLRRERHRLPLRVSGGRIIVVAAETEKASGLLGGHAPQLPAPPYSHVNCGMMGGVSSSRSSTPPAMG